MGVRGQDRNDFLRCVGPEYATDIGLPAQVEVPDGRDAPTAMRIISMLMVRRAGATHSP